MQAVASLRRRQADDHALAKELAAWSERLTRRWPEAHIGHPIVSQAGDRWRVSVPVMLGELTPADVRVQLYAAANAGAPAYVAAMEMDGSTLGVANGYVFVGEAPATRPAEDFTVRMAPWRREAVFPTELPQITWQK